MIVLLLALAVAAGSATPPPTEPAAADAPASDDRAADPSSSSAPASLRSKPAVADAPASDDRAADPSSSSAPASLRSGPAVADAPASDDPASDDPAADPSPSTSPAAPPADALPPPPAAPADPASPAPAASPDPAPPTDPASAPPTPSGPLTTEGFTALVRALVDRFGEGETTITTPGFDAFDQVRAALSEAGLTEVSVTRVSELAEAEKVTARFIKRGQCVLYVKRSAGRFDVTPYGTCGIPVPEAQAPALSERDPASGALRPPSASATVVGSELDLRLLARSEWDLAMARIRAPDPVAATVMSGLVGFGTGHFYAESPSSGVPHLIVQLLGSGLIGVGTVLMQDFDVDVARNGALMLAAGSFTFGLSRAIECMTAPRRASKTAARQLDQERRLLGY